MIRLDIAYKVVGMALLSLTSGCTDSLVLTSKDLHDIEMLDRKYVESWFSDNPQQAVLDVFENGVVFIPHHGDTPVVGLEELKSFLWPESGKGIVHSFNHYPSAIDGNNHIAWVYGRFDLKYSWVVDSDTTTTTNEGNYLLIARKQENAKWKIASFISNDPEAIIINE